MKIYSFPKGGIQFDDPDTPSRNTFVTAFLPSLALFPLVQHTGGRVRPLVSPGDMVREGMLIGAAQEPLSANIHATVPGRVLKTASWTMSGGGVNEALVIRLEGAFEKLGRREEIFPWYDLSQQELLRLIAEYGVVEMEDPGRPAADLFAQHKGSRSPLCLTVRCVFDDPWLASDYVLCRERLSAVAEGSVIAARAAGANRIIFAVSYKEKDLGSELLAAAASFGLPVSLVLVGSRYPQKNRRELELALRLYEKREGLELGFVLPLGPATLTAIYDAVKMRKPALDRYVTVGGSAVKNPQVMKVRLGSRIGSILEECDFSATEGVRIGTGSPLQGRLVADLDEPVTKTCYGIFAILKERASIAEQQGCIGCGECRVVCPLGLDPEALFKAASGKRGASSGGCHGCGCCEAVCPSALPLSSVIYGV